MRIQKYGRYWAVYDVDDSLIVIAVYKKGAEEVVRRLTIPLQAVTSANREGKGHDDS